MTYREKCLIFIDECCIFSILKTTSYKAELMFAWLKWMFICLQNKIFQFSTIKWYFLIIAFLQNIWLHLAQHNIFDNSLLWPIFLSSMYSVHRSVLDIIKICSANIFWTARRSNCSECTRLSSSECPPINHWTFGTWRSVLTARTQFSSGLNLFQNKLRNLSLNNEA